MVLHPCLVSHQCRCVLQRQPFVPLHLCIDSHLCRCIVQRLCVADFKHPCLKPLGVHFRHPCLFMNALLALRPCLVSHQCRCVLQRLSVADFKHPCLKPLGVHFRHPCLFMNALLALRPCKAFGRSFQASLPCLPLPLHQPPSLPQALRTARQALKIIPAFNVFCALQYHTKSNQLIRKNHFLKKWKSQQSPP